jgi:hypothetical protein
MASPRGPCGVRTPTTGGWLASEERREDLTHRPFWCSVPRMLDGHVVRALLLRQRLRGRGPRLLEYAREQLAIRLRVAKALLRVLQPLGKRAEDMEARHELL